MTIISNQKIYEGCGCWIYIAIFISLGLALGLGLAGGLKWPHNWAMLGSGIAFAAICVMLCIGAFCAVGGCCDRID